MGAAESSWHRSWALLRGAVTPRIPGTGASLNLGAAGPGSFPAAPTALIPLQLGILLEVAPAFSHGSQWFYPPLHISCPDILCWV